MHSGAGFGSQPDTIPYSAEESTQRYSFDAATQDYRHGSWQGLLYAVVADSTGTRWRRNALGSGASTLRGEALQQSQESMESSEDPVECGQSGIGSSTGQQWATVRWH